MTKKEMIDFCEMKSQLEPENEDIFNHIAKILEQETVPREHYESEYLARKQAEYELWKIKEQQPNEDCVSRQAILNKIKEVCFSEDWLQFRVDNGSNGQRDFLINYIEELPSVTPTQRWIPVSERLPNHDEYIKHNGLFIVSDGNRSYSEWFDIYDKRRFGEPTISGFRVDRCVIAWMPLPELYKAEMESEE